MAEARASPLTGTSAADPHPHTCHRGVSNKSNRQRSSMHSPYRVFFLGPRLDHVALAVGGPAESGRTPTPPAPLARRDTLFGDHAADTAAAQVSSEGPCIITSIRYHYLRTAAWSAASRAGAYPHSCQQFRADGALVLLSRRKKCRQRIT